MASKPIAARYNTFGELTPASPPMEKGTENGEDELDVDGAAKVSPGMPGI